VIRWLAAVLLAVAAGPVCAQERIELPIVAPPRPATAEQVFEAASAAYGPPGLSAKPKAQCPTPRPGDGIVVCAQQQEQSQFRTAGSPIDGDKGAPRAPNLETQYPMVGPGVVFKGCFIPPCPPPMPKIIDLKAIPEAPPGSDADRAAHGLAPARGSAEADERSAAARRDREARGTPEVTPPGSASPAVGP
jgi:hypothetical protein